MNNQDPLKQDPLKRYIKGMNSIQPSLLDPIQAAGWKAANQHKNKEAVGEPGPGTIELLLKYSKGKSWTKWTALLFGVAALIYCYIYSYSILASIFIITCASFCGYTIIGMFELLKQVLFYAAFAYIIFKLLYWIGSI